MPDSADPDRPALESPGSLRVDVLGVGISCIDLEGVVETFNHWITSSVHEYVCVTGMHGVMESRHNEELRAIHNRSGITTPDGMPMVWSGRWAGGSISRVYGPDLMRAIFSKACTTGWSHFFFGGTPEVNEALVERMRAEFPGLNVVGTMTPPFRPLSAEEETAIVQRINETAPDIIWVCLGTPKQERWMAQQRDALNAPVLVGVGAAFDLLAGTLPQAPRWMQRSGLEWLFRLAVEPRRLWRRYLLNMPLFIIALIRQPPRLIGSEKQAAEGPRGWAGRLGSGGRANRSV
jgi:N-acetylglucosaminyldiphosphoundecaprenol N-acetyl-beta-D-mannosaminyltransferase